MEWKRRAKKVMTSTLQNTQIAYIPVCKLFKLKDYVPPNLCLLFLKTY